jgi:integrase
LELLALKWRDVNFAESTLQVRRAFIEVSGKGIIETEPKTAKGRRSIQLPPLAIEALKSHRTKQLEVRLQAETWEEKDLIFCTSRGTPFIATYIHGTFKALLKKANLPDIRFHDLRHSAATLLLMYGNASQSRTGVTGSQPDQHDHGYLLARDADHAKRRDDEVK